MSNSDKITYIQPDPKESSMEIDSFKEHIGTEIKTEGAIQAIRKLSNVCFLVIRTNRDHFQAVLEGEQLKAAETLQAGDFIRISGKVIETDAAYKKAEIHANDIQVVSSPHEPLPLNLGKKQMNLGLDLKLDQRVLTLRHLRERAIFKIQATIGQSFGKHLGDNGFTEIHSPKIVKAGAEGGANIFCLDYFGSPAYLAQSPQFYKQYMVPVFGRVFEVGPVFRAEKHGTTRHLNEYTSLDFEMGFIESFRDVMAMQASFYRRMIAELTQNCPEELEMLGVQLPNIDSFPAVRFQDIKDIVAEKYSRKYRDKFDLEPEEEKLISRYAQEELGSDFMFVTNYPWKKRPFYTKRSEDGDYTESFDMLFRGLEISTGGQRIHNYEEQRKAMEDKGLSPADFEDYLDLHKFGTPPHGGCGIGLERLTMKLLGKENVRETTLFPRDITRLTP